MQKTCERDTKANEVHNKKEDRKKYKKKGLKNLTFFSAGTQCVVARRSTTHTRLNDDDDVDGRRRRR